MPQVGDNIKLLRLDSAIERTRPLDQGRLDKTREALTLGGEGSRGGSLPERQPGEKTSRPGRLARIISFHPGRRRASFVIEMDADEERILRVISHRGALRERDGAITVARQDGRITFQAQ